MDSVWQPPFLHLIIFMSWYFLVMILIIDDIDMAHLENPALQKNCRDCRVGACLFLPRHLVKVIFYILLPVKIDNFF